MKQAIFVKNVNGYPGDVRMFGVISGHKGKRKKE